MNINRKNQAYLKIKRQTCTLHTAVRHPEDTVSRDVENKHCHSQTLYDQQIINYMKQKGKITEFQKLPKISKLSVQSVASYSEVTSIGNQQNHGNLNMFQISNKTMVCTVKNSTDHSGIELTVLRIKQYINSYNLY